MFSTISCTWIMQRLYPYVGINTFHKKGEKMLKDEIGTRMKEFYENVPKTKLVRRMPVAIRIDGKAFHTFTRGFQRPFDSVLMKTMQDTMQYLCENIQGCVFGYTQSDEISLILIDYKKLTSSAWFDYEVQKMCSISASMATMAFNRFFADNVAVWWHSKDTIFGKKTEALYTIYHKAMEKGAVFDARCFNIPKEEVCNLIYWRQLDATRNSIQMLGQANFSHNELQGQSCNAIQDMLLTQKDINWNNLPTDRKRGAACVYENLQIPNASTDGDIVKGWKVDKEMPILKGTDREYLERYIFVGE